MEITSLENKKIKRLAKLHQKKFRKQEGTYLIFGENSLNEGLKKELIKTIITTDNTYENEYVEVLYVPEYIMEKITKTKPAPRFCAEAKIQPSAKLTSCKVLVLDDLQDPGNVGTILRTARALGIKQIFLSNNSVDIYNPKVVKAMQGIEFHLEFIKGDTYSFLANINLPIITTFLDEPNAVSSKLNEFALVIGNEGNGINPQIKELDHQNCKIDIDFESINVAVATGIILYTIN